MDKLKIVKTDQDAKIDSLVRSTDHKTAVIWACDCAQRVLPLFEKISPTDNRPRIAIKTGRTWITTGRFSMAVIRKASLDAHGAARDVLTHDSARSAARAAGQAVAAAHVALHAIAAARYAAIAVRDATNSVGAVSAERDWQYQHLLTLDKN